jgi:hypothetical protein
VYVASACVTFFLGLFLRSSVGPTQSPAVARVEAVDGAAAPMTKRPSTLLPELPPETSVAAPVPPASSRAAEAAAEKARPVEALSELHEHVRRSQSYLSRALDAEDPSSWRRKALTEGQRAQEAAEKVLAADPRNAAALACRTKAADLIHLAVKDLGFEAPRAEPESPREAPASLLELPVSATVGPPDAAGENKLSRKPVGAKSRSGKGVERGSPRRTRS